MLGWVRLALWLFVVVAIVTALIIDFIHGGIAGTIYVGIKAAIIIWYAHEFILISRETDDERV